MYSNFVDREDLDLIRLDAEYYEPDILAATHVIRDNPYSCDFLRNVATNIKDGPGGWSVSTDDYTADGIPVLRGVNIVDGIIELDDCVFISPQKHKELDKHKVMRGDVVLSVRGTVGRAAVFQHEKYDEASINAAIVRMRPRANIDPYFLVAFFNCYYGRRQTERISNGAVQTNMNLTETGSNLIPIPPPEIQKAIGNKVRKLERLRRAIKILYKSISADAESLLQGTLDTDRLLAEDRGNSAWLKENPLLGSERTT